MRKIAFIVTPLAVLFAGSAIAQSYSPLSGAALQQAVAGYTFTHAGGVQQTFGHNGAMTSNNMSGSWAVRGDQLCTQWATVGSQTCYRVSRNSNGSGLRLTGNDGRAWTLSYR